MVVVHCCCSLSTYDHLQLVTMEADCHIFFIRLVYGFSRFDIPINVWNVAKHGVFSSPNAGKYGPEKTMYLDTYYAVQYITWYTWYINSNVTFTIWKAWYNDYKRVVPGISHEKLGLTKNLSTCSIFPYYITGIRQYSSVTLT